MKTSLFNRSQASPRSARLSVLTLLAALFWIHLRLFADPSPVPSWVLTPGPTGSWSAIACSADGTRLAAAQPYYGIYVSADSGASWTVTEAPPSRWSSLASSADGLRLVAASNKEGGGRIFTSTDRGTTWIETGAPYVGWLGLAISSDGGQVLASPEAAGPVYRSTDGGLTWAETESPHNSWVSLAMSADGNSAVAAAQQPDAIYLSSDGGQTWQRADAPPLVRLSAVAMSVDGARITAVTRGDFQNGSIYTSADAGQSWIKTSAPEKDWVSVASSADGSRLVAVAESGQSGDGGEIYTSTDSGATWIHNNAPMKYWVGVASSADGSKLAGVAARSGAPSGGGGVGIYTLGTAYHPWIVTEPINHVISAGAEVALHVGAEGGYLSYQWQKNGAALVDRPNLSGATTSTLALSNVSTSDIGAYSVRVMNSAGHVMSGEVRLATTTWSRSEGGSGSSVAISADGTRLAAAFVFANHNGFNGQLILSDDGGNSWADTSAVSGDIRGPVAMSSDGSRIVAGALLQLYVSSDSGATWKRTGSGGYWDLTCSLDGQTLLAIQDGEMQISHDFGGTWKTADKPDTSSDSDIYWRAAASSADGTKLVAAGGRSVVFWNAPAPVYVSADGGETWQRTAAPEGYWESVASSADGSTLVAASFTALTVGNESRVRGRIHFSRDSGATWSQADLPSADWRQVVCSADGTRFAAAAGAFYDTPGLVYRSTDAGATWFMAGAPDGDWSSIACSADGTKLVAATTEGAIWFSPTAATSSVAVAIARVSEGVDLSWSASAAGFILQQCSDIGAGQWSVVSESSIFGGDRQSVTVGLDSVQNFYRLIQP